MFGQYEDEDEELRGRYCNRFRYYESNSGAYISKDPIGLVGNIFQTGKSLDTFNENSVSFENVKIEGK
ncbi:hypothetical protein DKK70_09820 [Gilliamella apicola]|uniref:RHS repeat-associated core domain-containing protein n=1 Tax=Gilliamella apicola TaxID=1196095 RepID=A0A2V4EPX0_9GAMM|nr:hypothetical protein DKK70_09820 [Gilliamella apicola]